MTTIIMKSRGTVDRSSLSSINHMKNQGALTARNISTLNRPAMPGRQTAGTAAAARRNVPEHTTNGGHSNATAHTANNSHLNSAAHTTNNSHLNSTTHTTSDSHSNATAMPRTNVQKPLPPLARPIHKGQKVPLESAAPLTQLQVCFGWNTTNPQCDADVSAFLLGADGKVPGDSWFVFYGQTESPDKSCRLQTGNTHSADRQTLHIDLRKLNANVKKIVFVLTINDAFAKRLHFGMMKDAYVRILHTGQTEIASFKITDYYTNIISMMIGEIYLHNGKWKFNAVGNGVAKDLAGLCALYGVQVSD